jgi:hypothetical protein
MPRGPKGEKRPADVIGAAVMIGRIASGEIDAGVGAPADYGKDQAAVRAWPKGRQAARANNSPARNRSLNLCRTWPDQSVTGGLRFPDPVQRRLAFIQLGGVVR